MGYNKQGAKKPGYCYSKREEAAWQPTFSNPYFVPIFRIKNRPIFSKQDWWVQIDWATKGSLTGRNYFINVPGLT